jgi:pimeloyl-ACP methyl ester carboxylesterase
MTAVRTVDPGGAEARSVRIRWAGLAGREHGDPAAPGAPLVLLHGLTFDRRMWDPVLDALPERQRALALDLPGHGGSAALDRPGLAPVVEAIHEALLDAGLARPILVGHSIGAPLAAIYAANRPAAGVVAVDAPLRVEPFAATFRALAPELAGDGFAETWAALRGTWGIDRVPTARRHLLLDGERPSRELVLRYQADVLERPLRDVLAWRDAGLDALRRAGTPYVALQTGAADPAERAWLAARLPQAQLLVWPVGHHFPHLADPARFAALLTGLAAGADLSNERMFA